MQGCRGLLFAVSRGHVEYFTLHASRAGDRLNIGPWSRGLCMRAMKSGRCAEMLSVLCQHPLVDATTETRDDLQMLYSPLSKLSARPDLVDACCALLGQHGLAKGNEPFAACALKRIHSPEILMPIIELSSAALWSATMQQCASSNLYAVVALLKSKHCTAEALRPIVEADNSPDGSDDRFLLVVVGRRQRALRFAELNSTKTLHSAYDQCCRCILEGDVSGLHALLRKRSVSFQDAHPYCPLILVLRVQDKMESLEMARLLLELGECHIGKSLARPGDGYKPEIRMAMLAVFLSFSRLDLESWLAIGSVCYREKNSFQMLFSNPHCTPANLEALKLRVSSRYDGERFVKAATAALASLEADAMRHDMAATAPMQAVSRDGRLLSKKEQRKSKRK
jgi:hypothetical protein